MGGLLGGLGAGLTPMLGRGASALSRAVRGKSADAAETVGAEAAEAADVAESSVPCSSFLAGQTVLMADGSLQPIEQVRRGQSVSGYAPGGEGHGRFSVDETHQGETNRVTRIITADGTEILATPSHRFRGYGMGWIAASELTSTISLVDDRGQPVPIRSVETTATSTPAPVYNVSVEKAEDYYVSPARVLVHNVKASCRRLSVGATPGKWSATGQAVLRNMKSANLAEKRAGAWWVRVPVKNGGPRVWMKLDRNIHMGHNPVDAVTAWNEEFWEYGARSPEVRAWMRDPANYIFEYGPLNSSNGASLKAKYRRPSGWSGHWPGPDN
jgi:hypothetical protein